MSPQSSSWNTRPFDPTSESRDAWLRYHAYRRVRHAEFAPEDPLRPDDEVEAQMRRPWHTEVAYRWVTEQDGLIVASSSIEFVKAGAPEYESNKHLSWSWGGVCRGYRRQHIFRENLGLMHQRMDEHGARVLNLFTSDADPDGGAAIRAIGGQMKQVERQSRLPFVEVDWDVMRSWTSDIAERAPGYRLELWEERVPESVFEEYSVARTEMMNLMPWDDLEHGEIKVTPDDLGQQNDRLAIDKGHHHTYVARDPNGRILSITDVHWRPSAPQVVDQWFTGVHPDARGRGLGKAVKAAMMIYLKERYDPQYIQTENSQTNDAMLGINLAMGYRPYREWQAFQIDRDGIQSYLERRG